MGGEQSFRARNLPLTYRRAEYLPLAFQGG